MSKLEVLSDLFSKDKELKIGETVIKIKTVTLGDIGEVASIASKLMEIAEKFKKDKDHTKMILNFLATDIDSVIKLLKVTTDLKEEVIRNLNPAVSIQILSEVLKENADFFVQYVVPVIKGTAELSKVGQALSKG